MKLTKEKKAIILIDVVFVVVVNFGTVMEKRRRELKASFRGDFN